MTQSKSVIDSVVEGAESTCAVRPGIATFWQDSAGNFHRSCGPAIEWVDNTFEWYKHGKHHRLDGPAIMREDGTCSWWVDGRRFTEDEFYMFVDQNTGEVLAPPGKRLTYDEQ